MSFVTLAVLHVRAGFHTGRHAIYLLSQQVTTENYEYCNALAKDRDLDRLQTACSQFRKSQLQAAAKVPNHWQISIHMRLAA